MLCLISKENIIPIHGVVKDIGYLISFFVSNSRVACRPSITLKTPNTLCSVLTHVSLRDQNQMVVTIENGNK